MAIHPVYFPVSDAQLAHLIHAVKADAVRGLSQPGQSDEQQLIDQLRRGERGALDALIAGHHEQIARLVSRLSGWSNESEDLIQEVFVAALRGARRFRGGSRLSTWLTRIAINVCRHHHRTRLLRAEFWKRWISQANRESHEDASQSAQQQERATKVAQSVRQLSNKYREVIVLHYLEEMPIDEIAKAIGISRNTVEVRLHRARQMLHDMLAPMMEEK